MEFARYGANVPFRLHLGLYRDETARLCQWHVPGPHFPDYDTIRDFWHKQCKDDFDRRWNTVYDGRFANNGWLQELPKPLTQITWDGVVPGCSAPWQYSSC